MSPAVRRALWRAVFSVPILLAMGLYAAITVLGSGRARPGDLTLVDPGEPTLSVWIDGQVSAGGGELVVQLSAPTGAEVQLPEPQVEGLDFREDGEARFEQLGERSVITRRYDFSGNKNSYEVPALKATWAEGEDERVVTSDPLWIDIGVDGPQIGELADIREPKHVYAIPWGLMAGGLVLGSLLVAGGVLVMVRRQPPPASRVLHVRPDKKALEAWMLVRASTRLSNHERAVQLSALFREYVESALSFPAQKWTTSETLRQLQGMTHLPDANVARAKRLLRATDLVKFADREVDDAFFDELDGDLRSFIADTRPVHWDPVAGAPGRAA